MLLNVDKTFGQPVERPVEQSITQQQEEKRRQHDVPNPLFFRAPGPGADKPTKGLIPIFSKFRIAKDLGVRRMTAKASEILISSRRLPKKMASPTAHDAAEIRCKFQIDKTLRPDTLFAGP